MKLVSESLGEFLGHELFEFERAGDPKNTLNLGQLNQIKAWIKENTEYDIDGPYHYRNRKPLWICVKYNQPEFVKFLIEYGEDVHDHNDAALRWACGMGSREMVAMLLDAGANPNAEDEDGNHECFNWASRKGHYDIIDLLNRARKGEKFYPTESPAKPKELPQVVRTEIPQLETPEDEEDEEENNWI